MKKCKKREKTADVITVCHFLSVLRFNDIPGMDGNCHISIHKKLQKITQ